MIQRKKKIVLFLPHRADPTRGEIFSADLLPLELLQIATGPAAAGYEIVDPGRFQPLNQIALAVICGSRIAW